MKISDRLKSVDLFLLCFLLFFTMDKVVLKPVVILIGGIVVWKHLSKADIKLTPKFYMLIAVWAVVNLLIANRDFSIAHLSSFTVGIAYWVMSLLGFLIIKKRVDQNDTAKTEHTINAYFLINTAWSIGNLLIVMYHAHSLNPYMVDDERYGTSTGDFIRGALMGPSYLNMLLNSFFAVFYLFKRRYIYSIIAVGLACLTTSNFAIFILALSLVCCFFAVKEKGAKLTVIGQFAIIGLFYFVVASSNYDYALKSMNEASRQVAQTGAPNPTQTAAVASGGPADSAVAHFDAFQYKYGKLLSFKQTYDYLCASPMNLIFGAGIGGFSSQLAVRTSDLPVPKKSRLFDRLPKYVSPAFRENHYKIFYAIYTMNPGYHSIRHFPTSFVNQILGEYGIVGLVLFLVFYLFFFMKKGRSISYTWLLLLLLSYFLLFDYLFEYLSVVVFFELFYLLDFKERTKNNVVLNEG